MRYLLNYLRKKPRLKAFLKKVYFNVLFPMLPFSKKHACFYTNGKFLLKKIEDEGNSFFGYYDKTPFNKSCEFIIYHRNFHNIKKLPSPFVKTDIVLMNFFTGEKEIIGTTNSWNWQQGARLHWLSNCEFVYNVYNPRIDAYQSVVYSVCQSSRQILPFPIYDSCLDERGNYLFLTLNFDRLAVIRPDYGYFNRLGKVKVEPLDSNDGIWLSKGGKSLERLISLYELASINNLVNKDLWHKVNHLMFSPSGKLFLFLYRVFFRKGNTFIKYKDFLYLYDLSKETLKLIHKGIVSHYSWLNDSTVILTGDVNGEFDYWIVNVDTMFIKRFLNGALSSFGDGHPSVCKDLNLLITDTYPNLLRKRKLILVNLNTFDINILAEFFEPLELSGPTRCDLHPAFSYSCKYISFDTAYKGKRILHILERLQ